MTRLLVFFAILALAWPAPSIADDASYERGEALANKGEKALDEGDVEGALDAYRAALLESPEHPTYSRRASVLKRIVRLRRYVATEQPPEKWAVAAATLHAFYLDEGLADQALKLDRLAHTRRKNAGTAIRLAEALLELNRNAEAGALLEERSQPTFHEHVLLGLALSRLGKSSAAKRIRTGLAIKEDSSPAQIRDLARLDARLGAHSEALALLRTSLEKTPKEGLAAARGRIERCDDFTALRKLPAYGETMKTRSKVGESCSGGTSCGTCPSRGDCSEG